MRKLVIAFGLVLMASSAQATTLNVVGGILHGASDVLVDGNFYDVQFLDGTCIALFNGCDDVSDFTPGISASGNSVFADLASQALLDQVFLDGISGNFASNPGIINGCQGGVTSDCYISTPEFVISNEVLSCVVGWAGLPQACVSSRSEGIGYSLPNTDTAATSDAWAVWSPSTPIPEPNPALLLSIGLTGLSWKGRRSLRS